jgi:hypothetical protein
MDIKQAVEVVKQVVTLAQKGGLLSLQDAVITAQALQVLDASVVEEVKGVEEIKKVSK